MKRTIAAAAIVMGSAALYSGSAFADPATSPQTANLNVGVTIVDECTITTAAIAFPDTGIISTAVPGSGSITIDCTKDTAYAIGLGVGQNDGGSGVNARKLKSGSNTIAYQLYSDSGYAHVWGNASGSTVTSAHAAGADEVIPVYGLIAADQNVPVGTYSDVVLATIWYGADATGH